MNLNPVARKHKMEMEMFRLSGDAPAVEDAEEEKGWKLRDVVRVTVSGDTVRSGVPLEKLFPGLALK